MNEITVEEYKNILKMLNASEEDFNLAVETIINLDLYEHYYTIFVKQLALDRRSKFINRVKETKEISFAGVHIKVTDYYQKLVGMNPSKNFKDCFEYYVANDVLRMHSPFLNAENNFVESIEIKLKW